MKDRFDKKPKDRINGLTQEKHEKNKKFNNIFPIK